MTRQTLFAACLMAAAATSPVLAQDATFATPEELREKLVGNTFTGDMGASEYTGFFADDGTYHDAYGSGPYEVSEVGICYPGTDFGCYAATIAGDRLTWSQDGEDVGTGTILDGDAMNLLAADQG